MPSEIVDDRNYSPFTGLIYIFNLIVGTGALTLPAAFGKAGTVLGLVIILILAFMSFLTVTLVVEAMSISNALIVKAKQGKESFRTESINDRPSRRERDPLIPPGHGDRNQEVREDNNAAIFEIKERVEMGRMASMFFNNLGIYLFYACITVYLYGDLAIYIAAVAKSLRDITCTYIPPFQNTTAPNSTIIPNDELCWTSVVQVNRFDAYRIYAALFLIVLGPFVFFNVQKTKHLQILTSLMRWLAFIVMITLAFIILAKGKGTGKPIMGDVYALPNLFGVCVYSFMCHHSLPSLVTPIASKKDIFKMFTLDYIVITLFYLLLAYTGIYAFEEIHDLYTLNFEPDKTDPTGHGIFTLGIQYFLSLFPVFTLSTNFPIIAITLRNNLKALFNFDDIDEEQRMDDDSTATINSSLCLRLFANLGFPLMSIIPPFLVAIFVEDVQVLVSFTGSYAGAGIQYLIPIFLVYNARQCMRSTIDKNPYSSPFRHVAWLWFVLIWAFLSILFVTINHLF